MTQERWRGTEKQICKVLGKRHLGGPGEPDCRGGGEVVEVKHQQRPVNRSQMKDIVDKPWAQDRPLIVASTSGFTPGARRLAGKEEVHLYKVYGSGSSRRSRRSNPLRS